ncbi:MAG: conserved rane protein of unknown function, partial [Blastococcus sp.]|nr:conserved rane protein of unknown function [Blastococcus sp.]
MRRRARELTALARERIRAAREHDPHAWHDHGHGHGHGEPEPIDFVQDPYDDEPADEPPDEPAEGASRPPLGSPERGAPDLDGAVGP